MKRVVIIGCPGAGKSVFANKLHNKTKLPLVHLDFYYHQKENDYYNNKEQWVKRVEKLIAADSWIMDGNYTSTFDLRFKRADTIIFFDMPRRLSFYRVLKRRIEYRNKQRTDMPSDWKEKANAEFLKYVWQFSKTTRPKILAQLQKNKDKEIIVLQSPRQAQKYLDSL